MAKSTDRFIKVLKEGNAFEPQRTIFVDKVTGVNYLWINQGYSGGLTPMLNPDGSPVISPFQ